MKYFKLKNGKRVIVDDEDFNLIKDYNWYYHNGYARKNKTIANQVGLMHRLILDLPKGKPFVDHINGNGLDNRRKNIRICTQKQNTKNVKKHKDGSSKYKGVYYIKPNKNWRAQICIDYKIIGLGSFKEEKDAAIAYNEAAIKYHGMFAKLNKL